MTQRKINIIGYVCGVGAGDTGCKDGPAQVFSKLEDWVSSMPLNSVQLLEPQEGKNKKLEVIQNICERLANLTKKSLEENTQFIVIGGDHTCAIGSWSGARAYLQENDRLGLIWFDAHLDSHTPETTESGNIHGMPLACLLGYGSPELTQIMDPRPKLRHEDVCIIGARSFESGEMALLQQLGVRIYPIEEVQQRGIVAVLQEAKMLVSRHTKGYGLSIDLDGFDPLDAPGVGSPEANGVNTKEFCLAVKSWMRDPKLLGTEIVEYNPHRDHHFKTRELIFNLMNSLLQA